MNHVKDGQALLLSQFQRAPRLNAVLGIFLKQSQQIEDQLSLLSAGNLIKQASGRTLNMLGGIINQPRRNMQDDEYKLWLKARAIINKSSGTGKALKKITKLMLGPRSEFLLKEQKDHVLLQVKSNLQHRKAQQIFKLLNHAKPLGIEMIMKYSPEGLDPKFNKFPHTLREL